ncbi:MAG: archease [Candidatus Nanoarchaeia archaeon]
MDKARFKFLEHTADIKFQAFGKSLNEVFKNSALAMKEAITEKKVKSVEETKISVKGKDLESLLYNFLEELIYLLDAKNFLLGKVKNIKVNEKKYKLTATLIGDKASNYIFSNLVKAVTYNNMLIKKKGKFFTAQVVLDV